MPVMQTGQTMASPYLEEFKPNVGMPARVAILDQNRVSGVQGFWIDAKDGQNQDLKGFFDIADQRAPSLIGAPSQYYLLPVWVYTVQGSAEGILMYIKMGKSAYSSYVQTCQISDLTNYDVWITATQQGKGTRLSYQATQDGSYLQPQDRANILAGMDDTFWVNLDRAVVRQLGASDVQAVLTYYYAKAQMAGTGPQMVMHQPQVGGPRPGMITGGQAPTGAPVPGQLGAGMQQRPAQAPGAGMAVPGQVAPQQQFSRPVGAPTPGGFGQPVQANPGAVPGGQVIGVPPQAQAQAPAQNFQQAPQAQAYVPPGMNPAQKPAFQQAPQAQSFQQPPQAQAYNPNAQQAQAFQQADFQVIDDATVSDILDGNTQQLPPPAHGQML